MHVIEVNDQNPDLDPEVSVREQMKEFIRMNRALPPAKRADCMLVSEDILMRGVSLALLGEQVNIPEELLVCSLTNEGIDLHFGVPVIAYKNPISEIAHQATSLLTARILRENGIKTAILVQGKICEPTPHLESTLAG